MNTQKISAYLPTLKRAGIAAGKWFFLPAAVYFLIFAIFQPVTMDHFTKGFFLDAGDGFQNVWNIWWVNHALEHGQNPYFTTMLHWPHGTTLIPQTMNIYNGLVGFLLIHAFGFSLVEAVNFAVVFSFIMGGVTMFWFVKKLIGVYWVALVAGALFTFSSYHFAHAIGHLQLVSFEWIPLFLLAFWTLLEKMRYRYAFMAGGALFLVILCDYYYLFWSVILAGMWIAWKLWKHELKITKQNLKVLGAFAVTAGVLVGPLAYSLVHLNKIDPLTGAHDPTMFGMDPLTIFMPGGTWYWNTLTLRYWIHLPYMAETSIFFGFGLLSVLAITYFKMRYRPRQFKAPPFLLFWWIVLAVFAVLALGPHPNIFNYSDTTIPLPYYFLQKVFPTLAISGMPVRWILIALMAAIIIVSYTLSRLDFSKKKSWYLAGAFVLVSFIDLWPTPLPLTPVAVPAYVHVLARLPDGAVIDNAALSEAYQLRHQTVFEKPMAFGYVTRLPQSVANKDWGVFAAVQREQYARLCTVYHIRYYTTPADRPLRTDLPVIYQDKQSMIYDFHSAGGC
jgi:hypothetical protein